MRQIKNIQNKICILLTIAIIFSCLNINLLKINAEEEVEYPFNMTAHVEGGNEYTIRAIDYFYKNNMYISLRDMANLLSGTSKAFDVGVKEGAITIRTGMDYIATGGENVPFGDEINEADYKLKYKLKRNDLYVDDVERKYYSIIIPNSVGNYDGFITLTDFAMLFDVDMKIEGKDLYVNPNKGFSIDPNALLTDGFFKMVNSAIVGDASTGEIYFGVNSGIDVPMASTTKLMTYVVVMDAVTAGTISENEIIEFSYNAEKLASTSDGVIKLKEGEWVPLKDALIGMLLPSSNEMALALAETVAGSEEEFVKLMNDKAKAIGMSDSVRFYNCNGLPTFNNSIYTTKRQNMISAEDMFKLVQYMMAVYPEVTEITSLKSYHIDQLGLTVTNTNPLLYNMDGVVGLKTGTTTKAGYCLVTLMDVEKDGSVHHIMTAEFGSENSYTRGMVSELLLRYGKDVLLSDNQKDAGELNDNSQVIDISSPEKLIQFLIN